MTTDQQHYSKKAEEIDKGNVDIAIFMGLKSYMFHSMTGDNYMVIESGDKIIRHSRGFELGYHNDWNMLMPVIEKICQTDITPPPHYKGYRIEIVPNGYVKIEGFPLQRIFRNVSIEGSLINALYLSALDFLEQLNSITNKKNKTR